MAENQTPQNAPIVVPGETVVVTTPIGTKEQSELSSEFQTIPRIDVPANTIRNFIQTAQERTIVKTAPDIVVYLDGLPYLINSYLNDPNTHQEYVVVNFNDHVANFNASFDTDNLIPGGSIGLSIPNHLKYLYQAPGGNNLITTMTECQVFAKGRFLSPRGNSVYHRVFKGVVSHVTHKDDGKTLEISMQLKGVLRFLELMQINIKPGAASNSERGQTELTSNQSNLDPYEMIADTFLRGMNYEGFQLNTIANRGQTIRGSDIQRSIQADYIVKWQAILNGVRADTHIMGYTGTVAIEDLNSVTLNSEVIGYLDPAKRAAGLQKTGRLAESDPARDKFVSSIRGYTPDFGVSALSLTNQGIVSRLERLRHILTIIGFEGFQDINGEIIFKAPLYNLDVTNLTAAPSTDKASPSQADAVTDDNNPFVVQLDEIEGESETEDEGAIRCTRQSIQGNWDRGFQISSDGTLREVSSHIDIPKLARFGLREEPARTLGWIANGDKFLMYTYAVHEMVRGNRGYRTYSFQLPLRPELKLGFPMYLPHKDMYGYIKTVSINYNVAGAATMNVVLDTLRKRPMFPSTRTVPGQTNPDGSQRTETILTTQPNLVMQWTKPPANAGGTTTARPSTGDVASNDPAVNFVGNPATLVHTSQETEWTAQLQAGEMPRMADYRKNQVGTDWSTRADTLTHSFRIQNDKGLDGKSDPFFTRDHWLNPTTKPGATTASAGIDGSYFQAIRTLQPFTDEKGYEVVSVFPLGRWKSLPEAIKETREGKIVDYVTPQASEILNRTNSFLFAGLPVPSNESSAVLLSTFQALQATVTQNASFELDFSDNNQPGNTAENQVFSTEQPENHPGSDLSIATGTEIDLQTRVNLFITGTPQPLPATKNQLDSTIENNQSKTDFDTVIQDFKGVFGG
jgi:hypothetical protein